MDINTRPLGRRDFLRGSLAAAALAATGSLAACATSGTGTSTASSPAAGGAVSETNPFGVESGSTVDAVIFNGGYGIDYAEFAGKQVGAKQSGVTVKVTPVTKVAQTLQPRFVAGDPPDVIDNSGAYLIGLNTIRDQLAELNDVIEAKNYEGTVIKDTLYPGVTEPGTLDGKFIVLNYALTVYAIWYSASLFEENGWTVPKTYEEMLALGAEAKGKRQVPARLGQGGGDLLPDDGHRFGDQGGWRRSAAGAGESQARLLVTPSGSGRLQRAEEDHRRRLRQAGRGRDRVHRRPGPVEQR